jgi:hypothetical protein
MNYEEGTRSIPEIISQDVLWRGEAYLFRPLCTAKRGFCSRFLGGSVVVKSDHFLFSSWFKDWAISSRSQSHGLDQLVQGRNDALVEPVELDDSFWRQRPIAAEGRQ